MPVAGISQELEALEIRLLLEAVLECYGYDFRQYTGATMRRRILTQVFLEDTGSISGLQQKILHDPDCMRRLLESLTVHETSMFRDPGFYTALREKALAHLRVWPHLRIWVAGCSTGEEVHSIAILLKEEGLLARTRIYATDLSAAALAIARRGIYPLGSMQEFTQNYQYAGGERPFSEYYTARDERVVFSPALRERVVFAPHDLVNGNSFNEFHMILCRNVMIYFSRALHDRVHQLFFDSLVPSGILGLGTAESLKFTPRESSYEALHATEQLFRKVI